MNPAFSVIFLTTLIGAAQGLFLLTAGTEFVGALADRTLAGTAFFVGASGIALALSLCGLLASFFHLGHPERAWRAAAMWRTSWLSREVILLPTFMAFDFAYGLSHYFAASPAVSLALAAAGSFFAIALYVATGMIYAAIKVLKEWASPLTVLNFTLLGIASGSTLSAVHAAIFAPALAGSFTTAAILFTLLGLMGRSASLIRNAKLRPVTTVQTAIGIRHPRIVQRSMGSMGGTFNTREFFHGKSEFFLQNIRQAFLVLAFVAPALLLSISLSISSALVLGLAFIVQYLGLLCERWFFFAEANHPQNIYYQSIG